jgi:hypothetical protein
VTDDQPTLLRLDPESDACFERMKTIVAEEVGARIALNDRDMDDPAWRDRVAALAADALLGAFVVRPRTIDTPRYRWVTDSEA